MIEGKRSGVGLAVFVKTPGLSPIKTRLAQGIGIEAVEQFHRMSAQVIEDLLVRWGESRPQLEFYWAVAEPDGLNASPWRRFPNIAQGEGNLGQRLNRVFEFLWRRHEQVIFLGADSPQITMSCLDLALKESADPLSKSDSPFYLGPTHDGGFYLLSARERISANIWTAVEYSTSTTAKDLINRLEQIGSVGLGPSLYDVDRPEDLLLLSREDMSLNIWTSRQREIFLWARDYC